ncbi:histidine kinase [Halovivax gelatinilyticus]|uniref:histidine kinase n=1 Tax=Halovivax gelatinilyticus TaxID=2961597 RepID=UPI0020CA6243|nr:histidine kinase [Halovivax gelatinilyticus]
MDSLRDAFDAVEARERTLSVYTDRESVVTELTRQFSTRAVRVEHQPFPAADEPGFLVVKDGDGQFRGAVGLDHLSTIISPETHPPWRIDADDRSTAPALDFLENTIFTSFERRQMLAVTREIEERAWRVGTGTLYVGFQNAAAFDAQVSVYDRIARERELTIRIFIDDDWYPMQAAVGERLEDSIDIVAEAGEEIGRFWFVLYGGGRSDLNASGLLAEERAEGSYYGFWTDEPDRVRSLINYLESTY